jgi:hypothetical protein
MLNDLKDLTKSRRFWVTIGTIAAVVFKDKLPLTEAQMIEISVLVGVWVFGESLRSSSAKAPEHV